MEQRPTYATTVNDSGRSKLRPLAEVTLQGVYISAVNRRYERDGSRVIGLNVEHRFHVVPEST
jgi:hypothetical protein